MDIIQIKEVKDKVLNRVSSHNMNVEKFKTGFKIRLKEQFNAYKSMLDELDIIITELSHIRWFKDKFCCKYVNVTDADMDIRYYLNDKNIDMSIKVRVQSKPGESPSIYTYHIIFYKDDIRVTIDCSGGWVAKYYEEVYGEDFYEVLDKAIAYVSNNKLDCGDMLALVDKLSEINTNAKDELFNKVLSYVNGLIAEYDKIKN